MICRGPAGTAVGGTVDGGGMVSGTAVAEASGVTVSSTSGSGVDNNTGVSLAVSGWQPFIARSMNKVKMRAQLFCFIIHSKDRRPYQREVGIKS